MLTYIVVIQGSTTPIPATKISPPINSISPACRRTQDSVFVRILPQNLGLKSSSMGMSGTPKSEGVFRGGWETPR